MSKYYTPLRYPGGKQRLTKFIAEILEENHIDGNYVEPFAGGAGVAMELLINNTVQNIYINDKDQGVYAFWKSILDHNYEFCVRVSNTPLNVEEWRKQREIFRHQKDFSEFDVGFSFFYLNRCNRSGVLTGGVIGGLEQKGNYKIDARFNRKELIRRIEVIGRKSSNIFVSNLDAEDYITGYIRNLDENTLVYLDPPYFVKGKGLYLNHYKDKDHKILREKITQNLHHNWVLSYDAAPPIINLYKSLRFFTYSLQYSAAQAYSGTEVFVFSDQINVPITSQLKNVNAGLEEFVYGL